MNKGGSYSRRPLPSLSNRVPFSLPPYPLPLSTPTTQANWSEKLTVKLLEMHVRMHISAPVCKLMSERFLIGITMKIRSEKLTFMNSRKEPTRIVSVG